MNLALEEYLDYLKEDESISASIQGEKYTILYYPFFQNKTINVDIPVNEFLWNIWGDMDVAIVTTRSWIIF